VNEKPGFSEKWLFAISLEIEKKINLAQDDPSAPALLADPHLLGPFCLLKL
jgi:hypothetical protein